ncbi:MAG: hypothetical protein R3279_13935 [Putridiphycobacter sp.]|nr:hypothetical protein [Putridiphycobacter sp.]
MEKQNHPNHKRVWISSLAICLVLASFALIFALNVHNPTVDSQPIYNFAASLFIVLMLMALILGVLGSYLTKCPKCKNWIGRLKHGNENDDEIRFVCNKCHIIYKTGIEERD